MQGVTIYSDRESVMNPGVTEGAFVTGRHYGPNDQVIGYCYIQDGAWVFVDETRCVSQVVRVGPPDRRELIERMILSAYDACHYEYGYEGDHRADVTSARETALACAAKLQMPDP
jgi:hypothetical protein